MVFLSCFRHFAEQGSTRAEVISEIRAQLEACKRAQQFEVKFDIPKWENPRVLSFSLASQTMLDQSVDFDVLPAFDALGEGPGMVPRREMRRRGRRGGGRGWAPTRRRCRGVCLSPLPCKESGEKDPSGF